MTFSIPDGSGVQGETIALPVTVSNFRDVGAFQFSVNWSPDVLRFNQLTGFEHSGVTELLAFSSSNFNLDKASEGRIAGLWDSPLASDISLPDGASIFTLEFTIVGNAGAQSPVAFSGTPTARVLTSFNAVPLNFFQRDGTVSIPTGPNAGIERNIVFSAEGGGSPVSSGSLTLPIKVRNFANVNRFQFSLAWDPELLSFSKLGDFNHSASASELLGFDLNAFDISSAESGTVAVSWQHPLGSDVSLVDEANLVSLIFDVVGEAGANSVVRFTDTPLVRNVSTTGPDVLTFRSSDFTFKINETPTIEQLVHFELMDIEVASGSVFNVPVTVSDFENIGAFQFSLQWDPAALSLLKLRDFEHSNKDSGVPGFSADDFDLSDAASGRATATWSHGNAVDTSLPDEAQLFALSFMALGKPGTSTTFSFPDTAGANTVSSFSGTAPDFQGRNGVITFVDPPPEPQDVWFQLPEVVVQRDLPIRLPLKVRDFNAVGEFAFAIQWNPDKISYQGVEGVSLPGTAPTLPGLNAEALDISRIADGFLAIQWRHPEQFDARLEDESELMVVLFQAGNIAPNSAPFAVTLEDPQAGEATVASFSDHPLTFRTVNGTLTPGIIDPCLYPEPLENLSVLEDTGPHRVRLISNCQNAADYRFEATASIPSAIKQFDWQSEGSVVDLSILPASNFSGTVEIQVTVSSPEAIQVSRTFSLIVAEDSDPPIAENDNAETDQDTPITLRHLLDNDLDPDEDSLVIEAVRPLDGFRGQLTLQDDGAVAFDPLREFITLPVNASEMVSFEYDARDPDGNRATALVQVTVAGKNDAPVAEEDRLETRADTDLLLNQALDNDSDPDLGDTPTFARFSEPGSGAIEFTQAGSVLFKTGSAFDPLPANSSEDVVVEYVIHDSSGLEATGEITITVNGVNDSPIAEDDSLQTDEDTALKIETLLANDSDPDEGDRLAIINLDTTETKGFPTLTDDGSISYDPGASFQSLRNGETSRDRFQYTVADSSNAQAAATVEVLIEGRNDPPIPIDDAGPEYLAAADAIFLTPNVLLNDTDPEKDPFRILNVNQTSTSGFVSLTQSEGVFRYDPTKAFRELGEEKTAEDEFTYRVIDGQGAAASAKVRITVVGVNDPPIPQDDFGPGFELNSDSEPIPLDLTANDFDWDQDDTLIVTALDTTRTKGIVSLNDDGLVVYSPNSQFDRLLPNAEAWDTFQYTVSDANGADAIGFATVTVRGINDPPTSAPIPDYVAAPGEALKIPFTIADPDHPASEIRLEVSTDKPELFESGPAANPSLNGGMILVRLADSPSADSAATITIRLADPLGAHSETRFQVSLANTGPKLSYQFENGSLVIAWTGTGRLEGAASPIGPYAPVANGGRSPLTVPANADARFFRVVSAAP